MSWRPRIVAFLCGWSGRAAAEFAGVSRMRYDPGVIPIVVPCIGRISPDMIIEAFLNGADGVLIGGCRTPNNCHYVSGNFKAFKRVYMLKKLLQEIGIEPERLSIELVSGPESAKLVKAINSFVEEIRRLGPLGGKNA